MERLTIPKYQGQHAELKEGLGIDPLQMLIDKLAEYEDIGLTPEEIKAHEEMFTAYRHVCGGRSPKEVARALKLFDREQELWITAITDFMNDAIEALKGDVPDD
jgi:hypothetical protein